MTQSDSEFTDDTREPEEPDETGQRDPHTPPEDIGHRDPHEPPEEYGISPAIGHRDPH